MPELDHSMDLSVPPLQRPEKKPEKKSREVDLEELAKEIWMLLKANLREENDRTGRN